MLAQWYERRGLWFQPVSVPGLSSISNSPEISYVFFPPLPWLLWFSYQVAASLPLSVSSICSSVLLMLLSRLNCRRGLRVECHICCNLLCKRTATWDRTSLTLVEIEHPMSRGWLTSGDPSCFHQIRQRLVSYEQSRELGITSVAWVTFRSLRA
jgi:hypothetical protein